VPEQLGVSPEILDDDYILHIALLDPAAARNEVEALHRRRTSTSARSASPHKVDDYQATCRVAGGQAAGRGPYFVRVKPKVLDGFSPRNGFRAGASQRRLKTNSSTRTRFRLNHEILRLARRGSGRSSCPTART
jgi:hypothetical protein